MSMSSLEAYYPGNDLGSATLLDHSGNGKHLSFVEDSITNDGNGNIVFDGSGRAQEQNNDPEDFLFILSAFTFAATVQVDGGTGVASIWSSGNSCMRILQASSTIGVRLSTDGSAETIVSIPYTLGTEIFLTVKYDGTNIEVSDGTNTSTDTLAGPLHQPPTPRFRLGAYDSNYMTGHQSDVMLWSRALTADELSDLRGGWRPPTLTKGDLKVLLCIGQSNESGEAADATRVSSQVAETLNTAGVFFDSATKHLDGLARCQSGLRNDGGFSPSVAIGASLSNGWAVCSQGISGTTIATWEVGNASYTAMKAEYDAFIAELESLGYTPTLEAIVWIHGESAGSADQATAIAYESDLNDLISSYRTVFGNVPWFMTKLPDAFSGAYTYLSEVQLSQTKVAGADTTVHIVNTTDFVTLEVGELNHWDAGSAIVIGRRLGQRIIEVLDTETPAVVPDYPTVQSALNTLTESQKVQFMRTGKLPS